MADFDWHARLDALLRQHATSAADQRAFVAWALVRSIKEAQPASLPQPALKLLGVLAQEAGVVAGDDAPTLIKKLETHVEQQAPPALVRAFDALLREATLAGQGAQAGAAFAQFAGAAASSTVLGGGERPAGTTPGGLAQLSLRGGRGAPDKK